MAKQKAKQRAKQKTLSLRDQIKDCISKINELWIEFSELAYSINLEQKWLEWGYESAKQYVEEELQIDYRTWQYRVRMGKAIAEGQLDKNSIRELGWAKFKEIANLVLDESTPADVVEEVIQEAKKLSSRETAEFVRRVRSTHVSEPEIKKVTLKFKLVNEAAELVDTAIEKAKELLNTEDSNKALEHICAEWLAIENKDNQILTKIKQEEDQSFEDDEIFIDDEEDLPDNIFEE